MFPITPVQNPSLPQSTLTLFYMEGKNGVQELFSPKCTTVVIYVSFFFITMQYLAFANYTV